MSKETIIQESKEKGKFLSATGLQIVVRIIKKFVNSNIEKLRASLTSTINTKQDALIMGKGLTLSPTGELSVTLDTTLFKVVLALPTKPSEADINKIFVVIPEGTEGQNHKEYIWLPKSNKWEVFGNFSPEVDLSGYVKTESLNSAIESKVSVVRNELGTVRGSINTETTTRERAVNAINDSIREIKNKKVLAEIITPVENAGTKEITLQPGKVYKLLPFTPKLLIKEIAQPENRDEVADILLYLHTCDYRSNNLYKYPDNMQPPSISFTGVLLPKDMVIEINRVYEMHFKYNPIMGKYTVLISSWVLA
mgnify:CR=1 FL=1|jgi:hypothetical protein|nr:MAG TPA: hypothetical protein [Caudoviricetes sp.]